jgi:hypothetical protein
MISYRTMAAVALSAPKIANLDELLTYRELTEQVSEFLNKRLKGHLGTLAPLLAPARILGKYVGGRESAPRADEAYAELEGKYKRAAETLDFKSGLDEALLTSIGSGGIHIHACEYSYDAAGAKTGRKITMTSPTRWVATYGSDVSLTQFRSLLAGSGETRAKGVQRFALNAVALQVVLARNPSVMNLLGDLRYEFRVDSLPGLESIPMVMVTVPLPSFRPPDDLLLTAVRLSGVPAFIELIDYTSVRGLDDPLRRQIEALLPAPPAEEPAALLEPAPVAATAQAPAEMPAEAPGDPSPLS